MRAAAAGVEVTEKTHLTTDPIGEIAGLTSVATKETIALLCSDALARDAATGSRGTIGVILASGEAGAGADVAPGLDTTQT